MLGEGAGRRQGASFSPSQPCVTLPISDRLVSFPSVLLFSAVGLALAQVTPKLIKWVPLAHSALLQGSGKPVHPSRCLSELASGVYLLMNALQLWSPLLLSELMNNETRSNRKKWEKKRA